MTEDAWFGVTPEPVATYDLFTTSNINDIDIFLEALHTILPKRFRQTRRF